MGCWLIFVPTPQCPPCPAVLVFSTLVYYVELMELQAEPDDPRVTFRSIPGTFWWSVVTLLTVGYGDVVPGTVAGKVVAAMSMVVAVLLMALPVSVIGTTFTQHWVQFRARERREARTESAYETLGDLVRHLGAHMQVRRTPPRSPSQRACSCDGRQKVVGCDVRNEIECLGGDVAVVI